MGRRGRHWGFEDDYIEQIKTLLDTLSHTPIPLVPIAIWLGKSVNWSSGDSLDSVVEHFLKGYHITDRERAALFDDVEAAKLPSGSLFEEKPPELKTIGYDFDVPPDALSHSEGTLSGVYLRDIGPGRKLDLEFGERLTLIAGDNGLGKSFLLDVAWWALTGRWVDRAAYPNPRSIETKPSMKFAIGNASCESHFDWKSHSWTSPRSRPSVAALCMYARVDGSFAVFDEIRARLQGDRQYNRFLY